MRDNFNKQLEDLYSSVKYMGSLCEKAIENASQTVVGDNADKIKEYAKNVNFYEKEINHSEDYIEKLCMELLLHQQPVAGDLRTVSSALKLISDMERIGDQASDIAELSGYINTTVSEKEIGNGATEFKVYVNGQELVDMYNCNKLLLETRETGKRRNAPPRHHIRECIRLHER